ncbi:MAG: DegT/DnrJ/EryC1/StrS family aminotransferase, partial [Elusimicrobiota bacterium]
MRIPLVDMLAGYPPLKDEIETAVKNVFNKANIILGEEVAKFEKEFAAHNGAKYAVGVANGTDALRLALIASGIKPGDEIITSPFTFIATTETISQCGAVPVFADIDPVSYNLDPKSVESRLTRKTKAVIPVHLYGMPCDMDAFTALAKKHNLKTIEDTAQAFTGKYKLGGKDWKYLGSIGDCGAYSFFPAKNLGAFGDGGAVITSNDKIYEDVLRQSGVIRARSLRQLLEFARGVPVLPTPKGENVLIITGAGGSGVLLSDSCVDNGLSLMAM